MRSDIQGNYLTESSPGNRKQVQISGQWRQTWTQQCIPPPRDRKTSPLKFAGLSKLKKSHETNLPFATRRSPQLTLPLWTTSTSLTWVISCPARFCRRLNWVDSTLLGKFNPYSVLVYQWVSLLFHDDGGIESVRLRSFVVGTVTWIFSRAPTRRTFSGAPTRWSTSSWFSVCSSGRSGSRIPSHVYLRRRRTDVSMG